MFDEEVWYVDDAIPNGTAAAVALLEHRWAIPLREGIRSAGGFHLADAWIHPADLVGHRRCRRRGGRGATEHDLTRTTTTSEREAPW